ncbi:MAG TPA: family 16 glycosylhydrolase [Armatimonadota bacterium]|nr:family 16 glycosylhydrolase [Armatimonadota bacterium]
MSTLTTCLMLALALTAQSIGQPPGPEQWEPLPELTDEFDGDELDVTKWHDHNPGWKGRQPAFFAPENVTVSDGSMHVAAKREDREGLPEGYHTFTTGAVQSTVLVKYGYFEVRCKAGHSRASAAFWFYENTPHMWTEIDVFEIGAGAPDHAKKMHMNVHVFHTPVEKKHWAKAGVHEHAENLSEDYHAYGLKWTPKAIVFYFDGEEVGRRENTHWHQALTMNFDCETMPTWFGLPDEANLPAAFSTDYVRAWRLAGATEVRTRE